MISVPERPARRGGGNDAFHGDPVVCIKRAGADGVLTYFAKKAAQVLNR